MPHTVFVVNSGSTSIKYQLLDVDTDERLASGLVERIGEPEGRVTHKAGGEEWSLSEPIANHTAGMAAIMRMFADHRPSLAQAGVVAVGHRVVQGGDLFDAPALITPQVEAQIADLAPLAPLHNPAHLEGIAGAQATFGDLPQVAVFDTAFHRTLPPAAYTYAIPRDLAARYRIRRYGAHGTSHKYVSRETARLMGRDAGEINTIVAHLGGGASICAVRAGRSVEVSMGLTPLEGLVMATRCGDMDLAVIFHLQRQAGMGVEELDELCNKKSGLLALGGSPDMRDIHRDAAAGSLAAAEALATFTHRIKGYVGNYYAQLGRVDAIAFTAGIGENDPEVRAESLAGLERLGIAVDPERNAATRGPGRISPDGAEVEVWVVPTNEELQIAKETYALVSALG
jgi:acetate kinase